MITFIMKLFGIKIETLTIEQAKEHLGDEWRD